MNILKFTVLCPNYFIAMALVFQSDISYRPTRNLSVVLKNVYCINSDFGIWFEKRRTQNLSTALKNKVWSRSLTVTVLTGKA